MRSPLLMLPYFDSKDFGLGHLILQVHRVAQTFNGYAHRVQDRLLDDLLIV